MDNSSSTFTHPQLPLVFKLVLWFYCKTILSVSVINKKWAGQLAFRLFTTSPRFKSPERELAVTKSAKISSIYITGQRKIAVYTWGNGGPTVLLCHGWAGRATQFYAFIPQLLASGFQVIGYDAPGHGLSAGRRTHLIEVNEIVQLLEKTMGPFEAIIGHSFGSAVALLSNSQISVQAKKLVLISGLAELNWLTQHFSKTLHLGPKVLTAMREYAEKSLSKHFSFGEWTWENISPVHTIQLSSADLLIVHDKQDKDVPFEQSIKLAEASPQAKTIVTDGLGHRRILRDEQLIQQCIAFIS
jgi:pimeloyl-ACP methyl ester carboxylesterase